MAPPRQALSPLLASLRAAGEETRLRLLALLAQGELSVSDLTDILGQSQPRVSRHLKLMTEAGLVERQREGAWAYFRIAQAGPAGRLARTLVDTLDPSDAVIAADGDRLRAVRDQRAVAAQNYFARIARDWDRLRVLHAPDDAVEGALAEIIGDAQVDALLDLGTGTGRMLERFGANVSRAVGVDASHAMLGVARANIERAGLRHIELRQGDIHALPFGRNAFDLVLIHQVLHFLDDPGRAIRESAAALKPGGKLVVIDFAPHELDFLRADYAHRRLGFGDEQMAQWLSECGLAVLPPRAIAPATGADQQLTVKLWIGLDPRPALPAVASPVRELETV